MYRAVCKQILQSVPVEHFLNNSIDGHLVAIFQNKILIKPVNEDIGIYLQEMCCISQVTGHGSK
jgi:hypothetical protein